MRTQASQTTQKAKNNFLQGKKLVELQPGKRISSQIASKPANIRASNSNKNKDDRGHSAYAWQHRECLHFHQEGIHNNHVARSCFIAALNLLKIKQSEPEFDKN